MSGDRAVDMYTPFREKRSVRALAARIEADPTAWIETDLILGALAYEAREPLPEPFITYLRSRLDGTARKKQGRGRSKNASPRYLRDMLICAKFERFEAWLSTRQARKGLLGWTNIQTADWWQGAPSERAARMVLRRLELNLSWRTIRNIAYHHR